MSQYNTKTEVLSEKIDWISYTQKNGILWQLPPYISDKWKKISPLRNYTNGEENQQGVKRFWNTITQSQGKMVLLDGSASSILGENQEDFLRWLGSMDAKPTRLDFALDITHTSVKAQGCVQHLRSGAIVTHAQSAIQTHDEFRGGFTQYLGTKTSETYTRIYDKSKEQEVNYPWVRVETVYQGSRAEAALHAYLQCKSTRQLITRHVDFPKWRAWQRIMSGDIVELYIPPKQTNTRKWLLSQVAKSIAKELAMDEDHTFWFLLREQIQLELIALDKSGDIIDF